MTMATINLLMGAVAIFFTLGVALGALVYMREGLRAQGGRRRWNLFVVVILVVIAWNYLISVGQDFARASDARLLDEPADVVSLIGLAFFALVAFAILRADTIYWRRALRSLAAPPPRD